MPLISTKILGKKEEIMPNDLIARKSTHFVLWRPAVTNPKPRLILGKFTAGNPPSLALSGRFDLSQSPLSGELWEIAASGCNLTDGEVYHYWFEVGDSNPYKSPKSVISCTDPAAGSVDWRLMAPSLNPPYGDEDRDPAGVIKFSGGRLIHCDPGGETSDWTGDSPMVNFPVNNRIVIYLLPTNWARIGMSGSTEIGAGTFRDVMALIDRNAAGANFAGTPALAIGAAHLIDLGINTLELLPIEDSWTYREWGYSTSNYFAPDFELGWPEGNSWPTPISDLTELIKLCHANGMRFFVDMVMAFSSRYPYQNINFSDFSVQRGVGDPEEAGRQDFGGDLFKYNNWVSNAYDPVTGQTSWVEPASSYLRTHLIRWMNDFRVDGIRLDSIPNINNWDFIEEFKNHARNLWNGRWSSANQPAGAGDGRFLVVGEDLNMNFGLINPSRKRLDGMWNEPFKRRVRTAILGQGCDGDNFEWTVRKMIDCRLAGFSDGSEAVNYLTSHDVEGLHNERLYNFLVNNGVWDTEKRIKLGFVCLLTAVGIPIILAGDEFADQHDIKPVFPSKEVDPVNYDRMQDPWRKRIYDYVAKLVKLRTSSGALAANDTVFLQCDFWGKQVMAWQRGSAATGDIVVVVANFSDYSTPAGGEYVVHNWPAAPAGKKWKEVTQEREIPPDWVGREGVYPWEAKVYTLK